MYLLRVEILNNFTLRSIFHEPEINNQKFVTSHSSAKANATKLEFDKRVGTHGSKTVFCASSLVEEEQEEEAFRKVCWHISKHVMKDIKTLCMRNLNFYDSTAV